MLEPTLLQGDCLELLPTLDDHAYDLIFVDLPYGCLDLDWDVPIPLAPLWRQYRRLLAPGGAVVLTATMRFAVGLINANPRWFRYDLVWSKVGVTGHLGARRKPLRAHEHLLVFGPRMPRYNPQMDAFKARRSDEDDLSPGDGDGCRGRFPTSVLTITNSNSAHPRKVHPTQKPEGLAEWVIRTFTDPGGHVLDHCFGSGSAGVAAVRTGRRFTGVELDPGYFEVGRARIESEFDRLRVEQVARDVVG